MQWSKSLSMIVAVTMTGTGILVALPADAKSLNDKPVTIYGQLVDPDVPTRRVSYADLNLATLAGENTLNRRVGRAVRSVCDESVGASDFQAEISCHSFAWGGARPQIARAVMRARQIAATGTSSILPVAITLSVGPR